MDLLPDLDSFTGLEQMGEEALLSALLAIGELPPPQLGHPHLLEPSLTPTCVREYATRVAKQTRRTARVSERARGPVSAFFQPSVHMHHQLRDQLETLAVSETDRSLIMAERNTEIERLRKSHNRRLYYARADELVAALRLALEQREEAQAAAMVRTVLASEPRKSVWTAALGRGRAVLTEAALRAGIASPPWKKN